jgi:hypothetical protein
LASSLRAADGHYRNRAAARHLPSISKLYFTHSQHASGQSPTKWSIFALASLLWVIYGLLNRKAAIYAGNIWAGDEAADGEGHPDACIMDRLKLHRGRLTTISSRFSCPFVSFTPTYRLL